MQVPIYHLNLTKEWFEMVKRQYKKEEYRAISPFYNKTLNSHIKVDGRWHHPSDVVLCFSNGYDKNRPQILAQCEGLKVGFGKEEWGAEKDTQYNIFSLGQVLEVPMALLYRNGNEKMSPSEIKKNLSDYWLVAKDLFLEPVAFCA